MITYEAIPIAIRDERDVPRGKDIFYRCGKCGEMVPSQPRKSGGCSCGNVFIDVEYVRLVVDDWEKFSVFRRKVD